MEPTNNKNEKNWQTWLKRLGFAGFMFFLLKGLVWLGIFAAAFYSARC